MQKVMSNQVTYLKDILGQVSILEIRIKELRKETQKERMMYLKFMFKTPPLYMNDSLL